MVSSRKGLSIITLEKAATKDVMKIRTIMLEVRAEYSKENNQF